MADRTFNKKIIAIVVFIVIILTIYRDNIINIITRFNASITPFLYGLIIAYLLSPLYNMVRYKWFKNKKYSNAATVLFMVLFYILIVSLIINVFAPQIFESIKNIMNSIPSFVNGIQDLINDNIDNKYIKLVFGDEVLNISSIINSEDVQSKINENINEIVSVITSKLGDAGKQLLNIILSLVISIFMLAYKEPLKKGFKRIVKVITKNRYNTLHNEYVVANKIFSGFIIGKFIDSLIIMVITMIFMIVADMPYAILISTIIFITNMIPMVGPIIGAIPSLIIILGVNPLKSVIFLIFIIILQQIDGHIIGPKCIGSATGINPFWVLFSILIGGGTFGFIGLLLAVPVCAVIMDIADKLIVKMENYNEYNVQ